MRARSIFALAVAWLPALTGLPTGCGRPDPGIVQPVRYVCGELGISPGQFAYPRAIDRDATTLWIIDKQAVVQRIDPTTGDCVASFRMPEYEAGKPTGVTASVWRDGSEALYIPDTHYFRVMVYSPAKQRNEAIQPLATFGSYGHGDGQFIYPTDVAVLPTRDASGQPSRVRRIYVSEYGGHDRISVFDPDLRFLFSFGEFGEADVDETPGRLMLNRPQSIALDTRVGQERLVIADASHHRLVVTDLDGKLIRSIGGLGKEPGRFTYPYGLAMLHDGSVLVAEFGAGRVQRIDVERGEPLGMWGQPGRGEHDLASPWGVAVIGRQAFVLDSGHNRVLGFDLPRSVASLTGTAAKAGGAR